MEFQQAFNISRGLKHGFAAFKRAPLPLFLGGLFMQCTEGSSGGGGNSGSGSLPWETDNGSGVDYDYRMDLGDILRADVPPMPTEIAEMAGLAGLGVGLMIAIVLVSIVCIGLLWALRSWIHAGYIRLQVRALRSGEGSIGDLFSGGDRLVPMMIWKLLKTLITTGAFLVAAVPGGVLIVFAVLNQSIPIGILGGVLIVLISVPALFYIGLGLAFGDHAVTLDELGPTDALERSWELASGNRLHLFLFLLVYGLVRLASAIVGLLMLCIGWIVTIPIARAVTDTGFTESYLLLTGKAGLGDLAGVFD
ncbi:MAG: hypothetical protein ACI8RZ_001349 [Myxococcota bacterium]